MEEGKRGYLAFLAAFQPISVVLSNKTFFFLKCIYLHANFFFFKLILSNDKDRHKDLFLRSTRGFLKSNSLLGLQII